MESENRTYLLEGHLQYEKEGIWGKSNSYLHHDSLFQQVLFIKNHFSIHSKLYLICLLYTSDAADESSSV